MTQSLKVVGMMSGTSLDGMDLVLCTFSKNNEKWHYIIEKAETLEYPKYWIKSLSEAQSLNTPDFILLHNEYGRYVGKSVTAFLSGLKADLVASHGHTIFHQPEKGMTFQIGNGATIAAECGITVVSDFRTTDVALGGQGAPLVPVGDSLLFGEYEFCLNLGGFANISHDVEGRRVASDICPVNYVANLLANQMGKEFDRDGLLGSGGTVIPQLADELDRLEFYSIKGPKSLGREWIENEFLPVLNRYDVSKTDLLASYYEHVSRQISGYLNSHDTGTVLITGGGAFNKFIIEKISIKTRSKLVIPDQLAVNYKEAVIFAFLGFLRYNSQINCLASVTGARKDSSAGSVFLP